MMITDNDTIFEQQIETYLSNSPQYISRKTSDFDITRRVDPDLLYNFLRVQTEPWNRLVNFFGSELEALDAVINQYNYRLDKGTPLASILRSGLTINGTHIKLMQPKPAIDNSPAQQLYHSNQFAVVRKMRYSDWPESHDYLSRIDLCILLNGFPILTAELESELCGRNYTHGINLYRQNRNPENPLLRTAIVHFVIDHNYAFITTFLNGQNTPFLPFNVESHNPATKPDSFPTEFIWKETLQADSLLNLISKFINTTFSATQSRTFFPRYHQLRTVRNLTDLVKQQGPGHNYLIRHSSGSGKTKSMAWLAYSLENLYYPDATHIFRSVIMVSDRMVFNVATHSRYGSNLYDTDNVKDIRFGSQSLMSAILEGNRLIVAPINKFCQALSQLQNQTRNNFAVIIDEAHTLINNQSAQELFDLFPSEPEARNAMLQTNPDAFKTPMSALVTYLLTFRDQIKNLNFFDFTVAPNNLTLKTFGKSKDYGFEAHDSYTITQAIDEKFTIDVLRNYTTVEMMNDFIINNAIESSYEVENALSTLLENPDDKVLKARFSIIYFLRHTRHKIGGKAKALLICDSPETAAEYKIIFDQLISEEFNNEFKTLVSFPGEVQLPDSTIVTEESLNGHGLKENVITEAFNTPEFQFAIVADKDGLGLDNALLHTLFIDKKLEDIQCIRNFSRLNRCYNRGGFKKEDTMVIDFCKNMDRIKDAFHNYYDTTLLIEEADAESLKKIIAEIRDMNIYDDEQRNRVVSLMSNNRIDNVVALCNSIVAERIAQLPVSEISRLRKLVTQFISAYRYMTQILSQCDNELEKEYVFLRSIYSRLPFTPDALPMDILDRVDLTKLRIQMILEGGLHTDTEQTAFQTNRALLKEILYIFNEPYRGFSKNNRPTLFPLNNQLLSEPILNEAIASGKPYGMLHQLFLEHAREITHRMGPRAAAVAEELFHDTPFANEYTRNVLDYAIRFNGPHTPFDVNVASEKLYNYIKDEFTSYPYLPPIREVIDCLFRVLNAQCISPRHNEVNDTIIESFNELLCNDQLTDMQRRAHFNRLVNQFEKYLKKLYFIINNCDLTNKAGYPEPTSITDCIYHHPALRSLQFTNDSRLLRFQAYLDMIRDWRFVDAYKAPDISDNELRAAIHIVFTIYLYITAHTIPELQTRL